METVLPASCSASRQLGPIIQNYHLICIRAVLFLYNANLCLGSIGMNRGISELCYKGTVLQRIIGMGIPFVKFHGNKIWEPQQDCVISKAVS